MTTPTHEPAALLPMIVAPWISQSISVAAELGLADLVKDGARPVDELAAATGPHAPSLYRMLRALASAGVFVETTPGRFGLTPLAAPLLTDAPGNLRGMARFFGAPWHWQPCSEMLYSVRT